MKIKFIELTRGQYAIVDSINFDRLNKFKWNMSTPGYAMTHIGGGKYRSMQSMILKPKAGLVVDHINQDPTDNRIKNLRYATKSQNGMNQKTNTRNTSGFKGVSWSKQKKKWRAYIVHKQRQICLGYFKHKINAARAYDWAAKRIFKNFARTNL